MIKQAGVYFSVEIQSSLKNWQKNGWKSVNKFPISFVCVFFYILKPMDSFDRH